MYINTYIRILFYTNHTYAERDIAQFVERRVVSSKVLGSTPGAVTKSDIAG
jgi:hypothetical protein